MTPTLHTARLVLEPYVPADVEDFVSLFADGDASRYMGDGPMSEEESRVLLYRVFPAYDRDPEQCEGSPFDELFRPYGPLVDFVPGVVCPVEQVEAGIDMHVNTGT